MLNQLLERNAGQVTILQELPDPLHKRSFRLCLDSSLGGEDLADSFREAQSLQFLLDGKVLVFDLGNGGSFGLRAAHVKEKGEEGVVPAALCIFKSGTRDLPDHVPH